MFGRFWGRAGIGGRGLRRSGERYGRRERVGRLAALGLTAAALAIVPAAPPPGTAPSPVAAPDAPTVPASRPRAEGKEFGVRPTVRAAEPPTVSGPVSSTGDVAIAPPPDTFDEPAAPTEAPPETLAATADVAPAGGVWAVVIGINDYPGARHDLRYATVDAMDVDAALARYGVPPERRLLLGDRQATGATIRASLDWLVARAGPDATAVFFYAGHVRKLTRTTEAIVAADGDLVSDQEVADRLAWLQARRAWLVLASCYGGGFTEVLAPGRILTAAADANDLAYENSHFSRSYLVEYMVRRAMLEGHADRSIQASFRWAVEVMRQENPRRVPVQFDHHDGELHLGPPPPPPPPPAAPAPEQAPPQQQPPQEPAPEERPDGTGADDRRPGSCIVGFGTIVSCPD